MTFTVFIEQFSKLQLLPKAEEYRTLRIAEALNDNDRDVFLEKLSSIHREFETLSKNQMMLLSEVEAFLRTAKKEFHKVKNFLKEKSDRQKHLVSLDTKLQRI